MNSKRLVYIVIGLCFLLVACGGAKFANTWVTPGIDPVDWRGQKIVAFIISSNESTRRAAETALARELTSRGAVGVAGYTIVPSNATQDEAKARQLLTDARVVGAVVMQVVGEDTEISYTPGTTWYANPYYGSFYGGYWGHGWGAVYSPGHLRTDKIVSVETLIYSLDQNKLLWGGVSKTTNPSNVDKFIRQIVEAAGKETRKVGLFS